MSLLYKFELFIWLVTDSTISVNIKHSYNKHTCVTYCHVSHMRIRLRTIGSDARTKIESTIKSTRPINYTRCETQ